MAVAVAVVLVAADPKVDLRCCPCLFKRLVDTAAKPGESYIAISVKMDQPAEERSGGVGAGNCLFREMERDSGWVRSETVVLNEMG